MTTLFVLFSLIIAASGDLRTRAGQSWPDPTGIIQGSWHGSAPSFYHRLRFDFGLWSAVFLTEKDPGEKWGDLITGGVSYTDPERIKVSAGGLRVQLGHGLMLSHPGPWSGGDPFTLSKSPRMRKRLEVSESPGANDADPLTGIAAEYHLNSITLSTVLGWSQIDRGSSGLHRTETEAENRRAIDEKLAIFHVCSGPFGISVAHLNHREGILEDSFSRVGVNLLMENGDALLTGEVATDLDSTVNFVISGSRGLQDVRHALTVSRHTGWWPRSSGLMGTNHKIGAGYGLKWKIMHSMVFDAGVLVLDKEENNSLRAGFRLSEKLRNRTRLVQRLKITATDQERTYRAQVTASWSPYPDLTLSLKVPVTWYQGEEKPDENGAGVEIRLKHSPLTSVDLTVSAAASRTDGWNSRTYAYSLSFPGEFGSRALYNSSVLLQSAVSVHISRDATLRAKGAWFNMDDAESLGSGSCATEGSSRTSAGIQLDWDF